MNEPEEVIGLKGNSIQRKISVDYISFSAHVDYSQNSEFIEMVKAQHVVRLFISSSPFPRMIMLLLRSLYMENKLRWAVCEQR